MNEIRIKGRKGLISQYQLGIHSGPSLMAGAHHIVSLLSFSRK